MTLADQQALASWCLTLGAICGASVGTHLLLFWMRRRPDALPEEEAGRPEAPRRTPPLLYPARRRR